MAETALSFSDADLQAEEWRSVIGFEGAYEVSSLGRMRSIDRYRTYKCFGYEGERLFPGRILKTHKNKDGYFMAALCLPNAQIKLKPVHAIVLAAFDRLPEIGEETRHLDGDRSNNRPWNLKWGTAAENMDDRIRHGTLLRGERHARSKLKEVDIPKIRAMRDSHTLKEIALAFGVSKPTISHVLAGRVWSHVK